MGLPAQALARGTGFASTMDTRVKPEYDRWDVWTGRPSLVTLGLDPRVHASPR